MGWGPILCTPAFPPALEGIPGWLSPGCRVCSEGVWGLWGHTPPRLPTSHTWLSAEEMRGWGGL